MSQITEETPIVIFGDDWGRNVSTLQHMFAHLVTRHRVIWVNSFGHRAPQLTLYDLRRAIAKTRSMFAKRRAADTGRSAPARIIEPRALPWHNIRLVRRLNTASLQRDIRAALHAVAPGRAPLLITGTPAAVGVIGTLGEAVSLYFCMDDYGELPGVDRDTVAPLEAELLRKVDGVVATAKALVELKRPASGLAYALPQGVNYEHFATPQPLPVDAAALPAPRIGFAGGVSSACDFDLIEDLAKAFPEGSIVLVGGVQAGVRPPRLPNVHLLGHRPYSVLPAYVQAFDVGLIPYILNDWTRSVDPLKLLEYLAAGIPVVSTDLPEALKYAATVRIASDRPAFVQAVRDALAEGRQNGAPEARQAVAGRNTWQNRAFELIRIAREVAVARKSSGSGAPQGTIRR